MIDSMFEYCHGTGNTSGDSKPAAGLPRAPSVAARHGGHHLGAVRLPARPGCPWRTPEGCLRRARLHRAVVEPAAPLGHAENPRAPSSRLSLTTFVVHR